MLKLQTHGVFCVRHESGHTPVFDWIATWLAQEAYTDFKACLWITSEPIDGLQASLNPHLRKYPKRARALDIIHVRDEPSAYVHFSSTLKALVRAIASTSIRQPTLVFIDNLEHWLETADGTTEKKNLLGQLTSLNQWTRNNRTTIVASIRGDFPQWTPHASGLVDINHDGSVGFHAWWQYPWGSVAHIWNFGADLPDSVHYLLRTTDFETLHGLGNALYNARLMQPEARYIHVQTTEESAYRLGPALMRLGADTVFHDRRGWTEHQGIQINHTKPLPMPPMDSKSGSLDPEGFGSILQEIYAPGLLRFVDAKSFSSSGLMLCQVATEWGLRPSLSRLSMLRHISPMQAARLTNRSQLRACLLATTEAIYLFRIWSNDPTDALLDDWLNNSFQASTASLFAGGAHYLSVDAIKRVLISLNETTEALVDADVLDEDTTDAADSLADIWDPSQNLSTHDRPWLARLSSLADVDLQLVKLANTMGEAAS